MAAGFQARTFGNLEIGKFGNFKVSTFRSLAIERYADFKTPAISNWNWNVLICEHSKIPKFASLDVGRFRKIRFEDLTIGKFLDGKLGIAESPEIEESKHLEN